MLCWRLTERRFAEAAFTGEGSSRFGGRWNSRETFVVYAAESLALAILEVLVNADRDLAEIDFIAHRVLIPDGASSVEVACPALAADWNATPIPQSTRLTGDRWIMARESLTLLVPSSIVPLEHNVLINPAHPEFSAVRIEQLPSRMDPRLFRRSA